MEQGFGKKTRGWNLKPLQWIEKVLSTLKKRSLLSLIVEGKL